MENETKVQVQVGHTLGTRSLDINKLAEALAKAQGEIELAKADSENPFFKSKYANLASVWQAIRGPLSKNGLAVVQTTKNSEHLIQIITTLMHSSGQWFSGTLEMPAEKKDPQTYGKVVTYGRRYGLAAMVGVAQDDDDAEAEAHGTKSSNGKVEVKGAAKTAAQTQAQIDAKVAEQKRLEMEQAKKLAVAEEANKKEAAAKSKASPMKLEDWVQAWEKLPVPSRSKKLAETPNTKLQGMAAECIKKNIGHEFIKAVESYLG